MDSTGEIDPGGSSVDGDAGKDWIAPSIGQMGSATARALGAGSSVEPEKVSAARSEIVTAAVRDWSRRLVNLDGRNRMLYFRELRRGTLEITPTRRGVRPDAVAKLLDEGSVALDELFEPGALADAALRSLAISSKARSNFEEKGLATLFIGHSFASWTRADGHRPRAPIAMIPVRIRLEGPGGHDAAIEIRGRARPNPSLVHAMRADLGRDPYPDRDSRPDDFREWIPAVVEQCRELPDFAVDDRLFVANLEFSKLPMVTDMEQHREMLIANDVVAAIAGDDVAHDAINLGLSIDRGAPDQIDPREEFLVCDADASQNYAISAVLQRQSLVVHGPPGTGKSQTIANLISSLSAMGKSVLFVAEKRAAIGAVTRRLEAAGCGELVLDLHDGSSRRQVIKSLDESLRLLGPHAAHDEVLPHSELEAARKKLVAHRRQMHQPRSPHGLSFFELQAMVGTPDHEITGVRLSADAIARWDEVGRAFVAKSLDRWRVLVEHLEAEPSRAWKTSHIRAAADAAAVKAELQRITLTLLPAIDAAGQAVQLEIGVGTAAIDIADLAQSVSEFDGLAAKYRPEFFVEASDLSSALAPSSGSWVRRLMASLFNRRYRRAKRRVRELSLGKRSVRAAMEDASRAASALDRWNKMAPDLSAPGNVAAAKDLTESLSEFDSAFDALVRRIPMLGASKGFGSRRRAVLDLADRPDLADARAELVELETELAKFGLGPVLRDSTADKREETPLTETASRVFAASAIDAITWQEPELSMFTGKAHERVARDFARLDRRHMEATAPRVMKRVAQRAALVMKQRSREAALLRHEVETGANHMPIRQLLNSMTGVVQALRPCWAMSPLLVSQMLPPEHDLFDVVVFDEGSQILPIHAIPAIARAGVVVVAGDPQQLPPSEYQAADSLEDEPDDDSEGQHSAVDAESILDVMRNLIPEVNLRWHYRSQDERLISFSNSHIYERELVTFPGTNRGTDIKHVHAPGVPQHAEGTSSNPEVVRRVVQLILDHAAKRPDESLGVIALGKRHATDISRALRVARLESDRDFGGFFEEKGAEPFFVKIMSNAQGDERDHIIMSIGYGPNPEGQLVYRWGALNLRGGHRRLNVAITRAKRRMTVVSAITSDDIEPDRTKSRGTKMLRDYLEYVEQGGELLGAPDTAPLTAFEVSVLKRLKQAAIPVDVHFGGGRHRIDFGAFDSKYTKRPVLAIETDGVGYDSSFTARDRDRLRLEVLAKRGWRHHRLWSIDWYRDPDGETARVKDAWANAVAELEDPSLHHIGSTTEERPVVAGRGRSPIAIRRSGILGYERDELIQLIDWIESDGAARTEAELLDEAVAVLGLAESRNHRVERALRGAIAEAHAPD